MTRSFTVCSSIRFSVVILWLLYCWGNRSVSILITVEKLVQGILLIETFRSVCKRLKLKMDDTSFKLMEKLIPSTYIQQAKDARNTRELLVNQLLEKVFSSICINFMFFFILSMNQLLFTEKVARRRMEWP